MFFLDEAEELNAPEIFHISHRELYGILDEIGASLEANPYVDRVPTHTEDGIPIRKLYVSNLPPKTSRTELFGIFAQYGFIKSCWLRLTERPNKSPTPTYAFVTYSDPADAHRALEAPTHEKCLRGRNLRISPADSWHQPIQDADGRVRWKVRTFNHPQPPTTDEEGASANLEYTENAEQNTEQAETSTTESEAVHGQEDTPLSKETYDILDVLNRDCLDHVLSYIPLVDIIRSERVSKRWQNMVQQHLESFRTFKTSWWALSRPSLTTAVLRRVLQRLGGSLTRLHIDHHWSALNDRTAHIVGKFCPNLEDLKVVGMHTKNWNPLIYGCKSLKSLKFVSCNKLTDTSLHQLVKSDTSVESISVTNNTHVTGSFLTFSNPSKLNSLAFCNCYSLQGAVLNGSIEKLSNLTTLRIDVCPVSMWKIIPRMLMKLPKLENLSLSQYSAVDYQSDCNFNTDFSNAFANLMELKILNLSKNIYVTNAVLKQVGQSCVKLKELNISSCNPMKNHPGVTDECLTHISSNCKQLSRLDVSYLSGLSDVGLLRAARLPLLTKLTARGIAALTARPFVACLANCPLLKEIDACGCDSVSEEVACAAVSALTTRPRPLTLYLAGTQAADNAKDIPTHKLLTVNILDDHCDHHLRPDFVDQIFEDSSEDSFDDIYEHDPFNDLFMEDEDIFLDDEDFDDYDFHNVILL